MAKKYKGFKNPNWKKNNYKKSSCVNMDEVMKLVARSHLKSLGIDSKY